MKLHCSAAALLLVLISPIAVRAQTRTSKVCVHDESGRSVASAQILPGHDAGKALPVDSSGCGSLLVIGSGPVQAEVRAPGFATEAVRLAAGADIVVTLHPATVSQQVEVTATRTPLPLEASASSVRRLTARELEEAPGLTLDDRLREVSGYQLFRRTGSWVANPTTQGTSLRGLGSTAASRTLVLSDQVPLNDAFGGWVHWNEIPQLAMREVEVMRGGASDLYGSSAIGGVIDAVPLVPEEWRANADLAGGSQGTFLGNGLLTGKEGGWGGLAAATVLSSNGYILTAPEVRGAVDRASNVHSQSGRLEARRSLSSDGAVFLRGNVLNEGRNNGTLAQTNATRLWRYAAGGDWNTGGSGRLLARFHGNNEHYRQSFSSVPAGRNSEQTTRLQKVPSQQVGGALQWAGTAREFTFVTGADLLDSRGTDNETPVQAGRPQATTSISARQRQVGGYGEVLWLQSPGASRWSRGISAALSGRVDSFRSFDARQVSSTALSAVLLPSISEIVFSPRIGLVKQVGGGFSLNASAFRAFRGPTQNELYRTGQVGQQITQANPTLRSERATGFELGALLTRSRLGSIRASYFWTVVNRPIAAVTISSTPTTLVQMRQNLGQLRSRGLTAEWNISPSRWLELTGGYQFADSTVTRFPGNPVLVGKWTAQVPRNAFSAQLRVRPSRSDVINADFRVGGKQFDDSENLFELHSYTQVNLYAEHRWNPRVSVYTTVQNLFDQRIEAGRTPLLTLASPRTLLFGVRLR